MAVCRSESPSGHNVGRRCHSPQATPGVDASSKPRRISESRTDVLSIEVLSPGTSETKMYDEGRTHVEMQGLLHTGEVLILARV
jgi:hypothetical protein